MNEAELKIEIFRIVDRQEEKTLRELYQMVVNALHQKQNEQEPIQDTDLNLGYQQMSEDIERENEATEWIEGTLDSF